MDSNPSSPQPQSPKQARILAGAVRALSADQRRANASTRQASHERQSKDIVLVPRMNVLDQGRPQQ
jgi:hypothetical protein